MSPEGDTNRETERLREDRDYRRGNPWEGCASGCAGHVVGGALLVLVLALVLVR